MRKFLILIFIAAFAVANKAEAQEQKKGAKKTESKKSEGIDTKKGKEAETKKIETAKEVKEPDPFPYPFPGKPPRTTKVAKSEFPGVGQCRIWYSDQPSANQPKAEDCTNLRAPRLAPGAFILHGGKAFDAEYDWREYYLKYPDAVPFEIIEVLYPDWRD
ncbi:MAG: hypothetical protein ACK40G_07300 [Cytophagaceae bacterium]